MRAPTPTAHYQLVVRDNAGGAGLEDVSTVTVAINNVNEAPVIPAGYSFGVNENVAVGTVVGTVAATDQDFGGSANGQLRYYFRNGGVDTVVSSDGRYAINATTGVITVSGAIDYEASSGGNYQIVVRDNVGAVGGLEDLSTVTIAVNNMNDAPVIPASYSFGVNENVATGTVVGAVAATDQDSAGTANGQLRYYFRSGGVDGAISADGRYAINATTGQITVNGALDYEAPSPTADYQVVVRDNVGAAGGLEDLSTVTIAIANLNDAPVIQSNYSYDVTENVAVGTVVGSVAATDQDSAGTPDGQLRYYFRNAGSESGISVDGRYAINATTGVITVHGLLDYEGPAPTADYEVVVRDNAGAAGGLEDSTVVNITIGNANDAPHIAETYSFGVNENVAAGTVVGGVAATDQDGAGTANGQLRYYFRSGGVDGGTSADGRYAINATTGVITVNGALDYEAPSPTADYQIVVRDNAGAAGGLEDLSTVTIAIANLNDAPVIPAAYGFDVDENVAVGTVVGTVAATDQDFAGTANGQSARSFPQRRRRQRGLFRRPLCDQRHHRRDHRRRRDRL